MPCGRGAAGEHHIKPLAPLPRPSREECVFCFFLIDLPRVRLRFDWPLQAPYACVHVLLSRSITINMPVTRHMHVHGASTCSLSAGMVQPPLVDLRVCRDSDAMQA